VVWRRVRGTRSPRRRLLIGAAGAVTVLALVALIWAPPVMLAGALYELARAPDEPPRLRPAEIEGAGRHLLACWAPPEASKAVDMRVTVVLSLNPDATVQQATLAGDPGPNPLARAFAESAVEAARNPRCQPLPLARERYQAWRTISLTFVSRRPPAARNPQ
jgi:hypothetical protein